MYSAVLPLADVLSRKVFQYLRRATLENSVFYARDRCGWRFFARRVLQRLTRGHTRRTTSATSEPRYNNRGFEAFVFCAVTAAGFPCSPFTSAARFSGTPAS
jgi:hypothetical protein